MDRRRALGFLAAGFSALAPPVGAEGAGIERAIRSSGERLAPLGLGTWLTFDVSDAGQRRARGEILREFFDLGGRLVGRRQLENSRALWRVKRFDLAQVHNFLDWETHLATLRQMKADGRVRYVGVTTSHGRRHDLAEKIMREEKIDFVQFTYNVNDRSAEPLFAVAADRGIAVIVNRPFDGGELFGAKTAKPLPGWGAELGCSTWAGGFLKFVLSQPAATCAIPATSKLAHLRENMRAMAGPLPDATMRTRIVADYLRA